MGRFYSYHGNGGRTPRAVGLILMAVGLLLVLTNVPGWMWASILGVALISVGFLIWRFG